MINNKFYILVLAIINVALMVLVLYLRFGNNTNVVSAEAYNRLHKALNNKLEHQQNIRYYQLYSEQRQIAPTTHLISEKNDTIRMSDQVLAPRLVLRYSELNCQTCVDALITALKQEPKLDATNTLILAHYENPAYLYQFKRMNRLQMPVYSIRHTILLPDTLNVPYFFVLNKNLRASHVFIPAESDTAGVRFYLTFIGKSLRYETNP